VANFSGFGSGRLNRPSVKFLDDSGRGAATQISSWGPATRDSYRSCFLGLLMEALNRCDILSKLRVAKNGKRSGENPFFRGSPLRIAIQSHLRRRDPSQGSPPPGAALGDRGSRVVGQNAVEVGKLRGTACTEKKEIRSESPDREGLRRKWSESDAESCGQGRTPLTLLSVAQLNHWNPGLRAIHWRASAGNRD
jgi:hypothetical protein